jgi:hypothetical protein
VPSQDIVVDSSRQCFDSHELIIYALTDPRDGSVRYVGKSHRTANHRLRRHLASYYLRGHTHKERWIRSLLQLGLEPRIIVLERCESADVLSEREVWWIANYRSMGGYPH